MKNPRTLVEFALGVVLAGLFIHLMASYLERRFPGALPYLVFGGAVVLLAIAGILLARTLIARLTLCRYAVEAFILNEQNELLLYRHPYHGVMAPPGGRVKPTEFPNIALERRLRERLALEPTQYRFDRHIHGDLVANAGNLGSVTRYPAPFIVQREIHKQRHFIRSHYDLIYVLNLTDGSYSAPADSSYAPVHFVNLEHLQDMVHEDRTFPDVLVAYESILAQQP